MPLTLKATEFPALWADYINKGDITGVVNLYQNPAVLVPTFSATMAKNRQQLEGYFDQLTAKEGLRVQLDKDTIVTKKLGDYHYVVAGIYSFQFIVNGASQSFASRFTFVLNLTSEQPIVHHHSSQIPHGLS